MSGRRKKDKKRKFGTNTDVEKAGKGAVRHRSNLRRMALLVLGVTAFGGLFWALQPSKTRPTQRATVSPATSNPPARVPPFYRSEEAAKPFPVTLSPARFQNLFVAHAYRAAQEIPGVLVQQPCYCYCDRYGHASLLDCYRSDHGAG